MTVLRTDRLTLRQPRLSDWPAHLAFSTSEAAAPLDGPVSPKDAWRIFAALTGHWTLKGYGWFTMVDADGVVGICGLHHPPPHADLEIGWITFAHAQRKGYATEAARAALAWGWPYFPDAPRIVSYIDPANAASEAVAARLGATCDGEIASHDADCRVWTHRRAA